MKNIYILPTDKFQNIKLSLFENKLYLGDIVSTALLQYIYITSDEEIKKGDYYITTLENEIFKANSDTIRIMNDANKSPKTTYKNTHFKIILTTDQDLIKDGVQEIPDEFLEWFVKNPSCEFIEVKYVKTPDGIFYNQDNVPYGYYKIIIPKEEPKQCDICKRYPRLEGTNKCESCYSVVRHVLEQAPRFKNILLPDLRKKEETLEEAAEIFIKKQNFNSLEIDDKIFEAILFGAKWQSERSYSEEEVGELVYNIIGEYGKHYGIMIDGSKLNELFEQFKKK